MVNTSLGHNPDRQMLTDKETEACRQVKQPKGAQLQAAGTRFVDRTRPLFRELSLLPWLVWLGC